MFKKLLLVLAVAGLFASCSTSKVATSVNSSSEQTRIEKTKYDNLSSTLAVEVKDDQEATETALNTSKKSKSNTATITVIDCDAHLADNGDEETESQIEPKSEQISTKANKGVSLSDAGKALFASKSTKALPFGRKGLKKLKSIRKLNLKDLPDRPGKEKGKMGLDTLVYIILVILLVLLIIRLLEVVVGPVIDILLLILLIYVIGRILGLW